jgi:hypothetical protein
VRACFCGNQHIGAEIGRGGFAVVFQALNVETGDFVAVKRFPLSTVDEESLASIQVRGCWGWVRVLGKELKARECERFVCVPVVRDCRARSSS